MAKTELFKELGEFKVGQMVLIEKRGFDGFKRIRPIDKITSGLGGTIFVDGYRFAVNGHQRGNGWYKASIRQATDEDRIDIRGKNASSRLAKVEWHKLAPSEAIHVQEFLIKNGIVNQPLNLNLE